MKLNEFLWWVAGADSERLQQCPSDQKRFGAIGMVILTTAFVAFLAGTAAAMFFTQKDGATSGQLGWSIAFGVLWAIIIFMIDRSLVVTMKKDPTKENQFSTVAGPFIFRMFLAAIIALMISTPLELYIFRSFIDEEGEKYKELKVEEFKGSTDESREIQQIDTRNERSMRIIEENKQAIGPKEQTISKNEQKKDSLKLLLDKPNTKRYHTAVQELNNNRMKLNEEDAKLKVASTFADSTRIQKRKEQIQKDINKNKKDIFDEKQKWNTPIKAQISKLEEDNEMLMAERDELKKEIRSEKREMNRQDSIRNEHAIKLQDKDSVYLSKITNADKLIRNYQILNHALYEKDENGSLKNSTMLFFYWLICIIFFLIELLPTLVKVITPVGVYDRLVYEEEKSLNDYFQSEEYHNSVLAQQKANMQYEANMRKQRQGIEGNSQLEILKQASLAQNEIANEAINKWKQDELKKLYASPTQNTNSEPI